MAQPINLAANDIATLRLVPGAAAAPVLVLPGDQQVTASSVASLDPHAGPHILGVRQIPESDPLLRGRVVAVLYDRDIDPASLGNVWHAPDEDLTLEFIATDYPRHMRPHLDQVLG